MKNLYKIYEEKFKIYEEKIKIWNEALRNYKANKTKENSEALDKAVVEKNTAFLEALDAWDKVLASEGIK